MNQPTDGQLPHYVKQTIDRLLIEAGGPRPMNYEELAAKMGMDAGQLSKVINRKQRVRLDTLQRIANALDVPLSALFAEPEYRARVETRAQFVTLLQRSLDTLLKAHDELVESLEVMDGHRPEAVAAKLRQEQAANHRQLAARQG